MWRRGWFCPSFVPVCPPKRLSTDPTPNDKEHPGPVLPKLGEEAMLSRNANHHPLVYYATGAYIYIILIYIRYSEEHDPHGPVSGPPGFASREVDPTGAEGSRLKGLRKVCWWLAVI